jgi:hypothetical protein
MWLFISTLVPANIGSVSPRKTHPVSFAAYSLNEGGDPMRFVRIALEYRYRTPFES